MNICRDCKYYLEYSSHCTNIYHILSKYKYYKDPITGNYNSVDCREFNSNGKCTRFEKPLLQTPIGIYIILLVLCILFLMFLIGISVGQHLG